MTSFVEILVSGTVPGEPGLSEDVAFPKVKVQIGSTLILDEFDRMTPHAITLARKRLRASVVKRELDISTPTLPGRGIEGGPKALQQQTRGDDQQCAAGHLHEDEAGVDSGDPLRRPRSLTL